MNYTEIIEAIKKSGASIEDFAYGYKSDFKGCGQCNQVARYGGEGVGELWYSVKYFPEHDVYIRVNGVYYSYDGVSFDNEWGDCLEVRPQEKTITVYE